ncbi:hypothetical protein AT291_04220 [Porphyromonas gingivalis]|nr:hypothetical protein EG14_02920 [Porphyromonas gingivalis]KXC09137.1 hypothetical protein AT291_04220 [Porphyromonas gingivalis]
MTKPLCRLWPSVLIVEHGTSITQYVVIVATTAVSWQSKKKWQCKNCLPSVDAGRRLGGKNEQKSPLDLFFGTFFLF